MKQLFRKRKVLDLPNYFLYLYCKLRFHDKEKEYKDNEVLRHAFTENLKHLAVNAKNNCKTKCKWWHKDTLLS